MITFKKRYGDRIEKKSPELIKKIYKKCKYKKQLRIKSKHLKHDEQYIIKKFLKNKDIK